MKWFSRFYWFICSCPFVIDRQSTLDQSSFGLGQINMAEFFVKSFVLFMWWRVCEACSQICYLTGFFVKAYCVKETLSLPVILSNLLMVPCLNMKVWSVIFCAIAIITVLKNHCMCATDQKLFVCRANFRALKVYAGLCHVTLLSIFVIFSYIFHCINY